jgi:hypothetical protein
MVSFLFKETATLPRAATTGRGSVAIPVWLAGTASVIPQGDEYGEIKRIESEAEPPARAAALSRC